MNLTDTSLMPFGPHEGTPMKDVPMDYVKFFVEEVKPWNQEQIEVMKYFIDKYNQAAIKDYERSLK